MTLIKPNDEWRVDVQPTGECAIPECPCHQMAHGDDECQDRQPLPLWADAATVRAAVMDVIDQGYQCEQAGGLSRGEPVECNLFHPWRFEFTVPETDRENQRRVAFTDAVLLRLTQLQHPPHNYPRRPVDDARGL